MAATDFASKLNDNSDLTLDRVPVDVALGALQSQVKELQRLVALVHQKNGIATDAPAATEDAGDRNELDQLREQVKELEKQNAKAEYRIKFLLRALEARDKQQHP